MEFLESLQSKFQKYHKKNNIIENRKTRQENQRLTRINLRNRTMDQSRALEKVVFTPAKVKTTSPKKASPKIDRRTKLKLWKQEREVKKEREKKEKKPIFKIGAATDLGFPDVKSFAPKKHTFQPPKNIKAIPLRNTQNQRVTRSQKPIASPPLELPKPTRKKLGTQKKEGAPQKVSSDSRKRRKSTRKSGRKSFFKSPENLEAETVEPSEEEKENKPLRTPENNGAYVSPFVTTSRGKGSVRKENLSRALRGVPSLFDTSSSASSVAYFTSILNNEISHLKHLCSVWNQYKAEEDLSEDSKDLIDVAVGQATLLMNKKFKQFEGLIQACETGVGAEKEVTCEDLQGFWDMIYMQVDNLNTRFNRLTTLKNNNWEEIEQLTVTTKVKKRVLPKTVKPAASSGIRAAILAARKNKQEVVNSATTDESVFNGGFFVIKTPQKNTPSKLTPKPTPKSILKSNKKKSVANLNKSVIFKAEDSDNESVLNTTFEKTPARKCSNRR